jgi:hypothetical protein
MADNVSQKRLMDDEEKTGEGELMPLQKRATPITFEQQIIDLIKEEKVKDDKEKEEKVKDDKEKEEEADIYNSLSIEIQEDNKTQYDKESRCSQSQPQSLPESQPFLQTLPVYDTPVISREDITLDQDCLNMIDEIYLDCQNNLREFFYSKISALNRVFESRKLAYDKFLQIEINTRVPGKFILEINMSKYEYDSAGRPLRIIKEFECVHFSLFTRFENGVLTIRGLHFTLPDDITTKRNKSYSHLYIGHIVAENSLGSADAANKFIITILKSIGTYFITQMSISNPAKSAKESVINFIYLLRLNIVQTQAIGQLLIDLGEEYKQYFKARAASGPPRTGGMKIMKYNKVVEKSNSKDGKNTLVNNKELKINKIKDKIKILKQDKIKNKDKIIKQIKLIEDIKTKIKIEKERAKQKHKEKASIIKRKASVSKTTTAKPKTTTTKPKTPKTTTTKPKTPKTTTTKPKTPKTTTAKPKTPKTTTAKPKTPKTTTAKPKTTTAKPKTPKTTTTKPKTTKTTAAKPKTTIAKPKTTTTKPKTPKTTTAKPKTTKRQANK